MSEEEIPGKVKVLMVIADRFGVTFLFCAFICWILFVKVQKVIDLQIETLTAIKINNESAKAQRDIIKEKIQDFKPIGG